MSAAELTHLSLFTGIGRLGRKWNVKKKCGVPTDQSRDTALSHTAERLYLDYITDRPFRQDEYGGYV